MIKLKEPANFKGELHPAGAVISLPEKIENRLIDNGYATSYMGEPKGEVFKTPEEVKPEIKPEEKPEPKPKKGSAKK